MYNVYIRSMTIYPELKELHYDCDLNIFTPLAFFTSYENAKEYILKNGKVITEKFFEIHEQGCSLVIIKQNNYIPDEDDLEEIEETLDLWLGPYTSCENYVFTEESYNMLIKEQKILASNDWAEPIPKHIYYVKDDGIYRGITEDQFTDNIKNYYPDSKKYKEIQWAKFKKNVQEEGYKLIR